MKHKIDKIIVFASALFLSFMLGFYSSRMIYFYKNEHNKTKKSNTFIEYIKEENIRKNNLLIEKNKYYYKSSSENNYIYFSGLMYRVLYVTKDSVVIISDENVTKLKYGTSSSYNKSDIKKWLDNEYIKNLNTSYLKNNDVSLMDKDLFTKIGGKKSYVISDDFWGESGLVITQKGLSKSTSYSEFLGVRPIITLKNFSYIKGNGTKNNPYIVEDKTVNILSDLYVGEYIKYNNKKYRVIEKNNKGVKVLSQKINRDHIFSYYQNDYNLKYYGDLAYYLNSFYIKELDKNDLVESNWYTGEYDSNYKNTLKQYSKTYIGILKVGDYFVDSVSNSFLLTKSLDKIYSIDENKSLFIAEVTSKLDVYPSFVLRNNLEITSGTGTSDNPYVVGDSNV